MPKLTVRHVTTYRYRQAVAFGEHRIMFRPRDSYDQRLLAASIDIDPAPAELHWMLDVFGNCVAVARFGGRRAKQLRFDCRIELDHAPLAGLDFPIAEHARHYPFVYDAEDMPDLLRSMERQYTDREHELTRWAQRFAGDETDIVETRALLVEMTRAIGREFTYVRRSEPGVQPPLTTLRLRAGTCRDFALLMMEAVRALGFAARFVSGYLYMPRRQGRRHLGGGATHAWVQVYVPGAGWMEFDPTNGIVGSRDLIRVAVVRDPAQAVPLSGTWMGFPADALDMEVSVDVQAIEGQADEGGGVAIMDIAADADA